MEPVYMDWQSEVDELHRRENMARMMGGPDKVRRQHDAGRLTIRERIDGLLDKGSFHEVGAITGKAVYDDNGKMIEFTPANCVMGRGMIDGRPVVVSGDDFTIRGGSADATILEKTLMAEQTANQYRLPIIRLIEGSGGGGSIRTIELMGRANVPGSVGKIRNYHFMTDNMAVVPVVSLGLGSVAGLGAARVATSHYSIMTKSTSAMFIVGPPLLRSIGQHLNKYELGGWEIQTSSGAVDHAVDSEEEAFACVRRFLSYLPASVYDLPPIQPATDDPNRRDEWLISAIPRDRRKIYKMRPIIETVVDHGTFFEMGQRYGRSIITGLARLDGRPVALMAGDPQYFASAWTYHTCQKVVRFVDLANTFHLPVVYLLDCPGFMIGLEAEKAATIRHGVRAMAAVNQATVPWCTVIVRNAVGVASVIHQPAGSVALRYAWPSGFWGSLPMEGGVEAAYRAEIEAALDPATEKQKIEDRLKRLRSPYLTAEAFLIEEIIDPRDTRKLLCEFARLSDSLRTPGRVHLGIRP